MTVCYVRAMFTSPGTIPSDDKYRPWALGGEALQRQLWLLRVGG